MPTYGISAVSTSKFKMDTNNSVITIHHINIDIYIQNAQCKARKFVVYYVCENTENLR